ncbi:MULTISPECIES: response regulator [Shouchella]|uniref:Response regulator transcription factor n=2 Tax=Shouchella TaxID=2893057 RepID=A0A4Y7WES1_9BACI|nr:MULTISPECIES: response regulator transcription factor [Shouchella]MBG9785012.1 LuxR family transcriptional regulator [Shouchella lehensis]RQW18713.1 DNA-binding response regulator [Bacillus sp. C1-1]TES46435.1 response regulator transcription factor [Shouchella lehensis]WDF04889.1 response regulator transcription factor [Shouchella hunanensis]
MKVMIVDDHTVVRKGLVFYLNTIEDMEIVGEANNGEEALQKLKTVQPDLILMDLFMPKLNGMEATNQIKALYPHVKILVLSSFSDKDHVIPALQAGADGYQLKDIDPEQLVETMRAVLNGENKLHDKVTKFVLNRIATPMSEEEQAIELLTKREREVLVEIASGYSNKEIADRLGITEKTVKTHLSHVFSKLHVSDRTQAALFAVKHSLL